MHGRLHGINEKIGPLFSHQKGDWYEKNTIHLPSILQ